MVGDGRGRLCSRTHGQVPVWQDQQMFQPLISHSFSSAAIFHLHHPRRLLYYCSPPASAENALMRWQGWLHAIHCPTMLPNPPRSTPEGSEQPVPLSSPHVQVPVRLTRNISPCIASLSQGPSLRETYFKQIHEHKYPHLFPITIGVYQIESNGRKMRSRSRSLIQMYRIFNH